MSYLKLLIFHLKELNNLVFFRKLTRILPSSLFQLNLQIPLIRKKRLADPIHCQSLCSLLPGLLFLHLVVFWLLRVLSFLRPFPLWQRTEDYKSTYMFLPFYIKLVTIAVIIFFISTKIISAA